MGDDQQRYLKNGRIFLAFQFGVDEAPKWFPMTLSLADIQTGEKFRIKPYNTILSVTKGDMIIMGKGYQDFQYMSKERFDQEFELM